MKNRRYRWERRSWGLRFASNTWGSRPRRIQDQVELLQIQRWREVSKRMLGDQDRGQDLIGGFDAGLKVNRGNSTPVNPEFRLQRALREPPSTSPFHERRIGETLSVLNGTRCTHLLLTVLIILCFPCCDMVVTHQRKEGHFQMLVERFQQAVWRVKDGQPLEIEHDPISSDLSFSRHFYTLYSLFVSPLINLFILRFQCPEALCGCHLRGPGP